MRAVDTVDYYSHKKSVETVVDLLKKQVLIPIWGSGYTYGAKAKKGTVPDAKEATCLMKAIIHKYVDKDYESDNFFDVASVFMTRVDAEIRDNFFRNYFTDVKLGKTEVDFLNLPWPHAYTINVDDGIENSSDFKVVLPYQEKYKLPRKDTRSLYKLHGDANYELQYEKENNIIFCSEQYLEAINEESNKPFLNNYKNDYKDFNLIYIGCGLNNEVDIKFVYNQIKMDCSNMTIRAVLRRNNLKISEEVELEKYGINTVFLVNDYKLFYEEVVNKYLESLVNEIVEDYPYRAPKVVDLSKQDIETNLEVFANGGLFDSAKNEFKHHSMMISRICVQEIEAALEKTNTIVVQGRRFCGKTSIICKIVEKFKKYDVYYFPSEETQGEGTVRKIIEERKNSLIIFDSNSLEHYAYMYLLDIDDILESNGNKLIIFFNKSENFFKEKLNAKYLSILNVLDNKELSDLNKLADRYGLVQRKERSTNLDYLKLLQDAKSISRFKLLDRLPNSYTIEEMAFLILLAAVDKIYSRQATTMNISNQHIDALIAKLDGLIERINTTRKERRTTSSSYKYVCNSKYCLIHIIGKFLENDIIDAITYIVRKFKNSDDERLYVEVVLFDTLNQLFGRSKGSSKIIYGIYEKLSDILNSSMDYWLQRAKSIYRLTNPKYLTKEQLEESYKYAYKAFADGHGSVKYVDRLRAKAAMSLSLICCLLSEKNTGQEKISNELDAIKFMYIALSTDYFRSTDNYKPVVDSEHRRGLKKSIESVCRSHLESPDGDMYNEAKFIMDKLELL